MGEFIAYQSGSAIVPVSPTNPLPVTGSGSGGSTPIIKAQVTGTNKSGTITTGGTAQTAIAANTSRKGWTLGGVSTLMTVTDDGSTPSATNGIMVSPGQSVDDGGNVSGATIQVWCATTGATFYATEYT